MRRRVASSFRRRVAESPPERLESLGGVRARIVIVSVFRVLPWAVDPGPPGPPMAVEWRIKGPDGGAILRTLVLREGRPRVRRRPVAEPDVGIEVSVADFLRLAAGAADPTELFFSGRLRVRGNMALALRLPRFLRPRSGG